MKTARGSSGADTTAALLAHFAAQSEFYLAELYHFRLRMIGAGDPPALDLYWTSAGQSITYGGATYVGGAAAPMVDRPNLRVQRGIMVDTADIKLGYATDLMLPAPHDSISLGQALGLGFFEGADFTFRQLFLPAPPTPNAAPDVESLGAVTQFVGRVGKVQAGTATSTLNVSSLLELLNMQLPRNIYQTGCVNTLFDAACQVIRPGHTETATVGKAVAGTATLVLAGTLSQPDAVWALGTFQFTSGPLTGWRAAIKEVVGQQTVTLLYPPPVDPGLFPTVSLTWGCDKTFETCRDRFGNLARYRGFPYIPVNDNAF